MPVAVDEIKKWTAIMVLVGMIMSIGGSLAITKYGVAQNTKDIVREAEDAAAARALIQHDVDENFNAIREIQECQSGIESDISVIRNDQRWTLLILEGISEELGITYPRLPE